MGNCAAGGDTWDASLELVTKVTLDESEERMTILLHFLVK